MVTAASIVLNCSDGALVLTPDETGVGGWCQVDLLLASVSRRLGAETLKYVAARLVPFLASDSTGQRWVFSLAELHTSAYGEHVEGRAILHLHDSHAQMFATLVLTSADKDQWLSELLAHAIP